MTNYKILLVFSMFFLFFCIDTLLQENHFVYSADMFMSLYKLLYLIHIICYPVSVILSGLLTLHILIDNILSFIKFMK